MNIASQFSEKFAVNKLCDVAEPVFQLFSLAISSKLYSAGQLTNILETIESDEEKSIRLIQEANNLLKSFSDMVESCYSSAPFEKLNITVENCFGYDYGLHVYHSEIGFSEITYSLIPDRLKPVVVCLIDVLCQYGHVIPEYDIFSYVGYSEELIDDVPEWLSRIDTIKNKDDVDDIINDCELQGIYLLQEIGISILDKNEVSGFYESMIEVLNIRSLAKHSTVEEAINDATRMINVLLESGYNKSDFYLKWCLKALTEIKDMDVTITEYNELFDINCDEYHWYENIVSIYYGNCLGIGFGFQELLNTEYNRQYEIGEIIGSVLNKEKLHLYPRAFEIHYKAQEILGDLIHKMSLFSSFDRKQSKLFE